MSDEQRLVEYFEAGAKGAGNCKYLGLEVEHFITTENGRPMSYEPSRDLPGVRNVLEHLMQWYPEPILNGRGDLLGLNGTDGSVTLEPAAQLEISVAPFADVASIVDAYDRFRLWAGDYLHEHGARLVNVGYHPSRRAEELVLIPKRRYDFMDAYFAHIKSHGMRMMRASASTQVSVDYADEADAVRKMRVASALSPILAAIADNTHVYEDKPNHVPLRRLSLWREVDNRRCGTVPGVFDEGFGFASYARWLLATSPIFVTRPPANDPRGPALRGVFDTPASEAYADAPMTRADAEHLMSMFWPDVRLKHFVEVRPADCLPRSCVGGYVALIKGVFYSEKSLRSIEEALGVVDGIWPLSSDAVAEAIAQIQDKGFDGLVYGESLRHWVARLFDLARSALDEEERAFLGPLEGFAARKSWWQAD